MYPNNYPNNTNTNGTINQQQIKNNNNPNVKLEPQQPFYQQAQAQQSANVRYPQQQQPYTQPQQFYNQQSQPYSQAPPSNDFSNYEARNRSQTNSPITPAAPVVSPTKQAAAPIVNQQSVQFSKKLSSNSLVQQQPPIYHNYQPQHNYAYQQESQVPPQPQQQLPQNRTTTTPTPAQTPGPILSPSPVNIKLDPWTSGTTPAPRSNATPVQPQLDLNGDFTTATSQQQTQKQSILSEINIDELFMHYPSVFEEIFYSNSSPFKLNSIEQIENDLRTYCEQFKPFITNHPSNANNNHHAVVTNAAATNATQQHFSIRI